MNLAQYRLCEGVDLLPDNSYQPTLSDDDDLPDVASNGLMVFATGNVNYITAAGVTDIWSVPASPLPMRIPVAIKRILATDTTVADTAIRVLANGKTGLVMVSNTVAPEATGTPDVGQTLSVTDGTWLGQTHSFSYQWTRDGVNIASATSNTYELVSADAETDVACDVTATNGAGSAIASSNAITVNPE